MKHVRHPNVVNLREVLASKTHVYIVLELVTGGELFDRIVTAGATRFHARVRLAPRTAHHTARAVQASWRSGTRASTSSSSWTAWRIATSAACATAT